MDIYYFIQTNALIIGPAIVIVILGIAYLHSLYVKKKETYLVVSKPTNGTYSHVDEESLEKAEVVTTEEIKEQVEIETTKKSKSQTFEAREWWKSLTTGDKKIYAFDAGFGERKLSTLKSIEILSIYHIFIENN